MPFERRPARTLRNSRALADVTPIASAISKEAVAMVDPSVASAFHRFTRLVVLDCRVLRPAVLEEFIVSNPKVG